MDESQVNKLKAHSTQRMQIMLLSSCFVSVFV